MKRSINLLLPLLLSLLLAACMAPSQAQTLPNSPVPAPVGVLNLIAVGIAVAGGLLGLILAARRPGPADESEAAVTRKQKNRKKRR